MMPWLAGHVIYPLQERAMHRPTFAYLRELEASQWLTREEIEQLQLRKLNRLLQAALDHSPWHATRIRGAAIEAAVSAGQASFEDLRKLPLMDKRDARDNVEQLVWRGVPGGAFNYNTGGSSGEPLMFHFGRERQASDAAGRMRARRWWGVQPGEREVYLWGAPVELDRTDRIKTLRDHLLNQRVLNAFAMSPASMDDYLQAIASWNPRCIYGYASSLALLAAHAEAKNRKPRLSALKVVCTTGEPLYPHQRELIERVFGVPAANEFGSRDIGFTAHATPEQQMLLMSESHILEVLDVHGNPAPPGELGEAVITGLTSAAQPFIRYRSGDMLRLSTTPCQAGRGLHVIEEVAGRQTDFVVRGDGAIMHALAVIYVLRGVDGIARFKCIQHSMRDMEVQVVPDARWCAATHAAVSAGLRERLGEGVRVEISLLEQIPPEASGKHRYVVSHVPLAGELRQAAFPSGIAK